MTTKHGSHLTSTLPAVLKEYLPEYEPKQTVYLQSGTRSRNVSQSTPILESTDVQEPANVQEPEEDTVRVKSEKTQPLRSTSSSQKNAKRKNDQKFAELSAKWDSTRHEGIEDRYEKLREKVLSQREIIRKQDEVAKQRKLQLLQEEQQQKEAEKARKHNIEDSLLQIAKQSLEEDRKTYLQEKRTRLQEAKALEKAKKEQQNLQEVPKPTPSDKMPLKKTAFKASLPPMSRTPSNLDIQPEMRKPSSPIKEDLEWHQEQLYKVFGNQADDFLNPKIEQPPKKANQSKLQKQGGRAGAQRLWEILRKESLLRLLQEDKRVPIELKEAYSAFVRQGLQKNWKYIPRSFASSEDVPDLRRLQDHSVQVRVRKKKHKTDLMFRASQSNKDRTEILTHNNPLPNINEEDNLESSVGRYLPSWLDIASEASEPEYMKWVTDNQEMRHDEDAEDRGDNIQSMGDEYDTLDQDLIMLMARKRKPEPKPKYIFLREKDATCKGKFSEKFKDQRDNKDIPKAFNDIRLPDFKSHSVMGDMDSGVPLSAKSDDRLSCQSAPLPDIRHRT
ncbi:hypothetical protein KUTeg_021162 [Tegillarca granosa]|uniref:Uncharacterized protein n=1 Tax=Tegillarca granosa TaxID=220873 RepID=A0ABQ9EFF7_TEGGR|nr:hypothetical protein KUTeg_021162 [Tegillarca granosa]